MYVSNNLGSFGGLGSIWGDAKSIPENVKAKAEAVKAKAKAEAVKAEAKAEALAKIVAPKAKAPADPVKDIAKEVDELEKELPSTPTSILKDPESYIPKPKEIVGANEAMQILKRPQGARGGHQSRTKGQVYWTQSGPRFSSEKVQGGKVAEAVPPPVLKLRPNVRVVRDMPALKSLAPVGSAAGFGEAEVANWLSIVVLGLVFLALFGYNTP